MPLDGVTAPDYTLTLVEPSLIDEAQSVSKGIDARRPNAPYPGGCVRNHVRVIGTGLAP